jgi:hypothetical protein
VDFVHLRDSSAAMRPFGVFHVLVAMSTDLECSAICVEEAESSSMVDVISDTAADCSEALACCSMKQRLRPRKVIPLAASVVLIFPPVRRRALNDTPVRDLVDGYRYFNGQVVVVILKVRVISWSEFPMYH